jgi:hypothetical protein
MRFPVSQGQSAETSKATLATPLQRRSNPVSADLLPKTGISSVVAGDFRQIGLGCREIGRLETTSRIAKTRRWRAFLLNLAPSSHTSELNGWRRSADRTRLQVDALPLGIFERKSAISQDLTEIFFQQESTLLG